MSYLFLEGFFKLVGGIYIVYSVYFSALKYNVSCWFVSSRQSLVSSFATPLLQQQCKCPHCWAKTEIALLLKYEEIL